MIEIIPSINAATFEEVQKKIVLVEPYVSWCHLDVTDGVFSSHPTWCDPSDLARLQTRLKAEVHLMVEEPEKIIDAWLKEPIKRVIVHLEATKDPELIIKKCRAAGREIGFAIRPDTSWEKLKPWCGKADMFVFLRVAPGASGQKMPSERFEEIRHLRVACSRCIIEVDGGVNPETAARAADAGADLLVVGAAIFEQPDIAQAIKDFKM